MLEPLPPGGNPPDSANNGLPSAIDSPHRNAGAEDQEAGPAGRRMSLDHAWTRAARRASTQNASRDSSSGSGSGSGGAGGAGVGAGAGAGLAPAAASATLFTSDSTTAVPRSSKSSSGAGGGGIGSSLHPLRAAAAQVQKEVVAGNAMKEQTSWHNFQRTVQGTTRTESLQQDVRAKSYPCVLLHTSWFRGYWDTVSVFLIFFNVLMVPYAVAFNASNGLAWRIIDASIDIFFFLDIVLNFRTSFVDDGDLVVHPSRIARHYLRGYFALDVLATLPFSLVLERVLLASHTGFAELPSLLRTVRVVRMVKILRLLKARRSWASISELSSVSKSFLRILRMGFWITVIGHILGCAWVIVYSIEQQPESWPHDYAIDPENATSMYLSALYFAFATITTVGYGDVSAHTNGERAFALVLMLLGAVLFATIVGRMSALAAVLNRKSTEHQRVLDNVTEFMVHKEFPKKLRQRMRNFFRYKLEHKTLYSQEEVLEDLSPGLRRMVLLHLNKELMEHVPFLRHANPGFVSFMVTKLRPVHVIKEEYVICAGEAGLEMYILKKGAVNIISRTGYMMKILERGAFFGEIACLHKCHRTVHVQARTACELLSLSRVHLKAAIKEYPTFAEGLRLVAQARRNVREPPEELKAELEPVSPPPHMKTWKVNQSSNTAFHERAAWFAQAMVHAEHVPETKAWDVLRNVMLAPNLRTVKASANVKNAVLDLLGRGSTHGVDTPKEMAELLQARTKLAKNTAQRRASLTHTRHIASAAARFPEGVFGHSGSIASSVVESPTLSGLGGSSEIDTAAAVAGMDGTPTVDTTEHAGLPPWQRMSSSHTATESFIIPTGRTDLGQASDEDSDDSGSDQPAGQAHQRRPQQQQQARQAGPPSVEAVSQLVARLEALEGRMLTTLARLDASAGGTGATDQAAASPGMAAGASVG